MQVYYYILEVARQLTSLIDLRFKTGPALREEDKNIVWEEIKEEMLIVAAVQHTFQQQQLQQEPEQVQLIEQVNDAVNNDDVDNYGGNHDIYTIIDQMTRTNTEDNELHEFYDPINAMMNVEEQVTVELTLFKREPYIPVKTTNNNFMDSLAWWQMKQDKFPLLSTLALRYLAIPTTSVPSE